MEINKCYNENCLDTMARMPDGFVDLTVTSPPYDNLRTYNGYCFDFENVAKELFRVTKDGGVVVWKNTITDYRLMIEFLNKNKTLLGHNIVRYDIPVLKKY